MIKRFTILVHLILIPFLMNPLTAETSEYSETGRLKIGVMTTGTLQALSHKDDTGTFPDIPVGFQSATGNMFFEATIVKGLDVYFELYLSSKHHEGYVMDREGYMLVSELPEKYDPFGLNNLFRYVDVKAGHFEVDFGNQHWVRSDNGQVLSNPLVGNYIVDVNTVEPGLELIGHPGPFRWVLGASTGTTTGDFKEGRGIATHGKLEFKQQDRVHLAASYYRVDHSDNATGYPQNGSYSSLFAGNRSGGRYSGILGGGPEPGQIKPGKGQDVTAWQTDAAFTLNRLHVSGLYGWTEDADINGSAEGEPGEEWAYYGAEVKFDIASYLYTAARYNAAAASSFQGQDSDGVVSRIQVGLGYHLTPSFLVKVEYVNQTYKDFDIVYQSNPEFSGIITEVGVAF
jgi:hypothetical protein